MINFLNTPPKFSPVYTDGLFFTVSADTNHFKFRYVYDVYVDGVIIFQGKATPNPFDIGVVDVSRILKSYVSNIPISTWNTTPIYTHETFPFSRPYADETINYEVLVGYEYADSEISQVTGFTGNGDSIGPPQVTEGLYKTFQSTMGVNAKSNEQNFDIGQFVLSGTPLGTNPTLDGLYLTNSPRNRDLDPSEYYTLGFTNYFLSNDILSEPYYVEYNFYDEDGLFLDVVRIDNITTNGGGPRSNCLDVYPATPFIYPSGNTQYNTLYVGAGPVNLEPIIPVGTKQYTVQLFGKFTGTTEPIQPTPTPTPTPSPTPPVSPCSEESCVSYSVTNNGFQLCDFTYWDCINSRYVTLTILPETTYILDCTCIGSITSVCDLTILYNGECINPSPCLTCYEMFIDNPTLSPCEFTWYDCNNDIYVTQTVEAETTAILPCACEEINTECFGLIITTGTQCSGPPPPTPTPSQAPLSLNWFFSNQTGDCEPNITDQNLTIIQQSTSNVLVNTPTFGSGLVYFYSGYLDIIASFVYQVNISCPNGLAIVAGTFLGDDSYGRQDIPSPSVGVTYTLSTSAYKISSGALYVTIIIL